LEYLLIFLLDIIELIKFDIFSIFLFLQFKKSIVEKKFSAKNDSLYDNLFCCDFFRRGLTGLLKRIKKICVNPVHPRLKKFKQ